MELRSITKGLLLATAIHTQEQHQQEGDAGHPHCDSPASGLEQAVLPARE